ncbi:MAG TPA: nuclease-related domain-containing protein [Kiritimatiellia bacterium]|nr:nuclease-related domain-containing protein [Kiritimatiellia bacterium]HMP33885.1 nuclease-related domain-containing protein [Kiritimatiellia bacterium]
MARLLTEETSLTRKRQAVLAETGVLGKLVWVEAAVVALLAAAGLIRWWRQDTTTLLILAAVGALFVLAHALKLRDNDREAKRVQAGLKGEAEVTRLLDAKLDTTHYLLNDCTIKVGRTSAQIDHLVVAPNGIFLLETKNWRGHIEGDAAAAQWSQVRAPGEVPAPVHNPVIQVRRQIDTLNALLRRHAIDWPDVRGMVLFTSPRTTWSIAEDGIPVLRPDQAVEAILRFRGTRSYAESDITPVVNALMRSR